MRFAKALVVFILGACSNPMGGYNVGRTVPYSDPQLRVLWNEVEACSGLTGNFDDVRFFVALDGITDKNGEMPGALWVQSGNKIFLTPPYKTDPRKIKHEEMHALLQGGLDHPAHYFDGVCGDLVSIF